MSKSPPSPESAKTVIFSACLVGRNCRYDGETKYNPQVRALYQDLKADGVRCVSVCPEELGKLGTPRPPAHLIGGPGQAVLDGHARVRTVVEGKDVTSHFVKGAETALELSGPHVHFAILKARSPSCGIGETRINGTLQRGDGVFAAKLRNKQVRLFTEEAEELTIETAREMIKS